MEIGEIQLRSGTTIRCDSIRQWRTYGGLLEGLPVRQWNEKLLASLLQQESKGWSEGKGPYLVPPVVRPIPYEGTYPFGEPEALPGITCVARYSGPSSVAWRASLGLIWFQSDFAFPIDPAVADHLAGIDWEALASPYEP